MSRKHFAAIAFTATASALTICVWYLKTIYNESLQFKPYTAQYYILVPSDITVANLSQLGSARSYYYSAADGPKPEIISVKILLKEDATESLGNMAGYFVSKGYTRSGNDTYKKSNIEISILGDDTCRTNCEAVISLMRYL